MRRCGWRRGCRCAQSPHISPPPDMDMDMDMASMGGLPCFKYTHTRPSLSVYVV